MYTKRSIRSSLRIPQALCSRLWRPRRWRAIVTSRGSELGVPRGKLRGRTVVMGARPSITTATTEAAATTAVMMGVGRFVVERTLVARGSWGRSVATRGKRRDHRVVVIPARTVIVVRGVRRGGCDGSGCRCHRACAWRCWSTPE